MQIGCIHSSPHTSLREEIKQRKADASEAFARKDIDGFVAFFAPDATLMFPDSDFIQGEPGMVTIMMPFYQYNHIISMTFYKLFLHD